MGSQSTITAKQSPSQHASRTVRNAAVSGPLAPFAGEQAFVPPGAGALPRSVAAIAAGAPSEPNPSRPLPLMPLSFPLQRKLAIGETHDPLESEADRMADRVLRMTDPAAPAATSSAPPTLQRKCACQGTGSHCKECEEAERGKKLHRKTTSAPTAASPHIAPPIVHEVLHSPGRPLDSATRAFFEPRFGYDFSNVRVHTDRRASESADSVGALAYTVNHSVAFNAGSYAPHTAEGKRLLAHELAHVVQQGNDSIARREPVLRRAAWGKCPEGSRANTRNPMIYTAAELYPVAQYKARFSSHCLLTNEMLAAGIVPRCKPNEQPVVDTIMRDFHHDKHVSRGSVASSSDVTRRPEGKTGALIGRAVESIAALQQPEIIDITSREVYDVTTTRQRENKVNKFNSRYLPLLRAITGSHWSAGTSMPPVHPLSFNLPRLATICYGPTDLSRWPGVIAYEATKPKSKKEEKKKKKSDEEEEEEKKKKAKGQEEEEENKKKQKGKDEEEGGEEAANVGFGIGILSTGGGGDNASLGIAINSHGVAIGTVSAGVVYDANGNALGTATAGIGAHVSGNAAAAAAAGAARNTSGDAAASAAAGTASDTTSESLANASAGTAKGASSVSIASASQGRADDTDATAIGKSGKAGETSEGDAAQGANTGASAQSSGKEPKGRLQAPGLSNAEAQKAVAKAATMDALVQKATPEQKALLIYLAQTMPHGQYEVSGTTWVQTFMSATSGLSEADIKYLQRLHWKPGAVSAAELRRQIDEQLKHRGEEHPGSTNASAGSESAAKDKSRAADQKLSGASIDQASQDQEKRETDREAALRLYKRSVEFNWRGMHSVGTIIFSGKSKVAFNTSVSGALYYTGVIRGKTVKITADVRGVLKPMGNHEMFEVHASSLIVSTDQRVWPGSAFVGITIPLKR